jgi:hypothetical protein
MTACYPTLWSDRGPTWCWGQPAVRRLFELAQPPGAYDAPVRARWDDGPPPRYFGGQAPYPTKEFLGAGSPVAFTLPQIYWATNLTPVAARGPGVRRLRKHRASFALAMRQGAIRSDMAVGAYLQTYGSSVDESCFVAMQFERSAWWVAKPGYLREAGVTAIRALCELRRRRYEGPDGIQRFQRDAGLTVDGWVGPMTLEALGVRPT